MNNQSHHLARERLSTALKTRQMTQSELSRQTGIKQADISRLIKGIRPVTSQYADAFSKVLGHTPAYWLGEDEPEPQPVRPDKRVASAGVHPNTGRSLDEWI